VSTKHYGISGIGSIVDVGKGGPKLKSTGGVLEVKDSADNAYANVTALKATLDTIQLSTSLTVGTFSEGKLYYNNVWKTIAAEIDVNNNLTLKVGQDQICRVYNATSTTIYKGQAVYDAGVYTGTNAVISVALARSDIHTTADVIGVVTQDIISGAYGFATSFGYVENIDSLRIGAAYLTTQGLRLIALVGGTAGNSYTFTVVNAGSGGLSYTEVAGAIILELGGTTPTVAQVVTLINVTTPSAYVLAELETAGTISVASVLSFEGGVATTVGDILYLSDATPGRLTTTVPSSPSHNIRVGRLTTKSATLGRIHVHITQAYALGDLADVVADSAAVDDTIVYNGLSWVSKPGVSVSGSAGISFYQDEASIISTVPGQSAYNVKTLVKIPRTAAEQAQVVESRTVTASPIIMDAYLYPTAINRATLDSGTWDFYIFCSASSLSNSPQIDENMYRVIQGVGTLVMSSSGTTRTATASTGSPFASGDGTADVSTCGYLQTPNGIFPITTGAVGGDAKVAYVKTLSGYTNEGTPTPISAGNWKVWKRQFGINTGDIPYLNTNYGLVQKQTNPGVITLTADGSDCLGKIVFARATNTNRVVYYVHNGANYASNLRAPLITLHNNLPGLNAAGGNYQHLTDAQLVVATQAATGSLNGYLASGDFSTFAAKATTSGNTFTGAQIIEHASGLTLGKDDTTNIAGYLKMFSVGANSYYSTFTAATQSANAAYTLPTALPAANSFSTVTSGGVMDWAAMADYQLVSSSLSYGFVPGYIPTLSFSATTYQVTLTDPSGGWKYDRTGVRCNVTGNKSVRLVADPGGNPAPAANIYYIYIDATDGTLTSSTSGWTLEDTKVPCAIVLWDDSATPKYHLADELHTSAMPRKWHWEHHFADGAELISGGTISGYTVNDGVPFGDTDNTFGIAETIFCDEDKKITNTTLSDPNGTDLAYIYLTRTGAATYGWGQSAVPFKYTTSGYINWNNGGTPTEGQSGKFYCSYVLSTNFAGDGRYMFMCGRGEYNTISEAAAESVGLFNWDGYPVAEAIVLYQLIWATDSSYTTKGKVRLADVPFGVMSSATALKNKAQEIKIRVIDDLIDVTIASPQLDQSLRYNGFKWVNGPASAVSAGPGVEFYECTPVINSKIGPAGLKQDGTAGNGIRINSLSRFPVITVSSVITVSIATPAVVNWTAHGLPISAPIVFTTTGALPTGITAGTTYYILSTSYGANSFRISASIEGAAINTSGTQSGVHTCTAGELANTGQAVSDTRAYAAWVSSVAVGRTTLEAGLWDFTTFAGVNSVGGGRVTTVTRKLCIVSSGSSGTVTTSGAGANSRTATITSGQFAGSYFVASATNTLASYLQTPTGIYQITAKSDANTVTITVPTGYSNESTVAFSVWNMLFGTTSVPITSITPSFLQVDASTAQPAFTVAVTDRLGQIDFVTSNNTTTVTTSYNGSIRNTHFTTPLIITHNELSGLQGGTGSGVTGEFYHLTSAQNTGLTGGGSTALHSHAVPTAITVAAEATDQTCYPLLVTVASGDLAPKTHASFGFDALNCYLGIGTPTPSYTVHAAKSWTNASGTVGKFTVVSNATTNGSYYTTGVEIDATSTSVTGSVADGGYKTGLLISNYATGYSFAGTIGALLGLRSLVGVGADATSGAVVTNAYGAQILCYNQSAGTTIINSYGVYIDSKQTATGTIANAWDIYAPNALANSYIAGNLGLGTTGTTAADAPLRIQKNQTTLIRLASGTGANYFDIGRQVESGVPLGWLKFYGNQANYGGFVFSSVDAGDYLFLHPSGIVSLGTADIDGTPATGKLVVQGGSADGTTNIFVGRDTNGANVALLDTNGKLTLTGFAADGTDTYIELTRTGGYGSTYLQQSYTVGGDYPYGFIVANSSRTYMSLLENATGGVGIVNRHVISFPNAYRVGIGTSAPLGHLHIVDDIICEFIMEAAYTHADYCPQINLKKCRTSIAAPTIVASGDRTAIIGGMGYDGANYRYTGWMEFDVDGTPGSEDMPGRWVLKLTPDGSNVPVEVLRVNNAGQVGIGTNAPSYKLDVRASSTQASVTAASVILTTACTADASLVNTALNIDATSMAITAGVTDSNSHSGIFTSVVGEGAGFAGTQSYMFGSRCYAGIGSTAAATAAVLNCYGGGFYCQNQKAGTTITNAYAVYANSKNVATGTITNAWDIYAASATSYNYFAGNVGIGVTAPGVDFEIQQVSTGNPIGKVVGTANPMWEVASTAGSTSHRGCIQMVGIASIMRVGTITDHPMYFSIHDSEVARFTTDGNFLVGTDDNDGTPATGRLVVQGAGTDINYNIFVGRNSNSANVTTLDCAGLLSTSSVEVTGRLRNAGGGISFYQQVPTVRQLILGANAYYDSGYGYLTEALPGWMINLAAHSSTAADYLNVVYRAGGAAADVLTEYFRISNTGLTFIPGGVVLGLDAATNTAGYIKMFAAGANAYYNTFTSGENTANATYTWPVAMPAVSGRLLACTDAGVMSWAAAPIKTIVLPAASAALGTTTPATRETRELTTNKQVIDVLKFPHAAVGIAWWTFQLPDSYDGGAINAKITYMNIATDGTNKFLFSLFAGCATDGNPLDLTMGTVQELEATVGDTAEDLKIGSWGTGVTPSGTPAGGKLLFIKLQRDPTDTDHDTTSLDAYVLGLRLEYTTNSYTD
jgi:hypothetical protein